MNREDIKEFNVNRQYISQNQPWTPDTLPLNYLPHRATKWYPPIFCLGVALSLKETEDFATHLGLPLNSRDSVHGYGISGHLTKLCGAKQRVMLKRCDQGGSRDDRIWVFSLATNYDISDGVDVSGPLKKYRETVKQAFGSSKEVMWWLEYVTNHSPGHWWVSAQPFAVFVDIC